MRQVTFELREGEALGIIGRNGAGKSTLLKLLSRVTRPSGGRADTYGRVGALLEVGTGFHPELTGRENTYLSGAILGLRQREVTARFDEIVDFAEIPAFIDIPVKHYSSGMYARLGYAVAAFLRPQILIIDEVLAVGDLSFQAKCLGHMRRLTREGTSVLFVSHNLLAMADFCPRALLLEHGELIFDGSTPDAIGRYRQQTATQESVPESAPDRPEHELRINGSRWSGEAIRIVPNDGLTLELEIDQNMDAQPTAIELNFVVETVEGRKAIHLRNDLDGVVLMLGPARTTFGLEVPDLGLVPGTYTLWLRIVSLGGNNPVIWDSDRVPLHVQGDQRLESVAQPRHEFVQL